MKPSQEVLITASLLWLCAVGAGLGILFKYETAQGAPASVPTRWPAQSKIHLDPNRPTLILLAHPQCPCTRASIDELASIMARLQGQVSAYVLFLRPKGYPKKWEQTDLWRNATAIPGVTVMDDEGGVEGTLFGGVASGQTVLYAPEGRLLFRGGITLVRGHSGDSAGSAAVVALVTSGRAERTETPVFGCALHNPSQEELRKVPSWKMSEK